MARSKRTGPEIVGTIIRPREFERYDGRLNEFDTAIPIVEQARQAIRDLVANGAIFHYRPTHGAMPASFTYELAGPGDLQRCRRIIQEAKADPLLWAAVVAEVAKRSKGAA